MTPSLKPSKVHFIGVDLSRLGFNECYVSMKHYRLLGKYWSRKFGSCSQSEVFVDQRQLQSLSFVESGIWIWEL